MAADLGARKVQVVAYGLDARAGGQVLAEAAAERGRNSGRMLAPEITVPI
ncbi:hypothetical protein ACFQV6_32940 [Actinoplanes sp. GCM10030250]